MQVVHKYPHVFLIITIEKKKGGSEGKERKGQWGLRKSY